MRAQLAHFGRLIKLIAPSKAGLLVRRPMEGAEGAGGGVGVGGAGTQARRHARTDARTHPLRN